MTPKAPAPKSPLLAPLPFFALASCAGALLVFLAVLTALRTDRYLEERAARLRREEANRRIESIDRAIEAAYATEDEPNDKPKR
jgi:hypothetical protein